MRLLALTLLLTACGAPARGGFGSTTPPTALEKQLVDNPNDAQVNLQLGQQSEASGDLLRAEQYYLRAEALGIKPDVIVPHIIKVLVGAKRYDEALERCQRRLAALPEDHATRFVTAAILTALDRPKEAERELNMLLKMAPNDARTYLALGRLYKDNDRDRARQMFEKFLTLVPEGVDAARVRFEMQELGQ
jgi:tetratricopeptide (TPR) repeat protein